jgi:hypothetical protein
MVKKAILYINRHLPYDKQIAIFDNYEWENHGYNAYPFVNSDRRGAPTMIIDPKKFDGYPFIYIDGHIIEPAPTELLIIFLARLLVEDLAIDVNFDGVIVESQN